MASREKSAGVEFRRGYGSRTRLSCAGPVGLRMFTAERARPALRRACVLAHDHTAAVSDGSPDTSRLAAVRQLTAKYHDLDAALADGYQLGFRNGVVIGCISNPTAGAMGYHYFNWAKMDDPSIHELDPEVLVYHSSEEAHSCSERWSSGCSEGGLGRGRQQPATYRVGETLHVLNSVLNWYMAIRGSGRTIRLKPVR